MKITKKYNYSAIFQAVAIILLAAFIAMAFIMFMHENGKRIVEQNDSFIEGAAKNTANRIDEIIESSSTSANLICRLYEKTLTSPEVDLETLQNMAAETNFDYVEFIDRNGLDLSSYGETADLSDREYFKRGIMGESGYCVVFNSRITKETLIIFYSPFYYDGEIIGVMSCIVRSETLKSALSSDYFGEQGSSYIIDRAGDIIASVGGDGAQTNILDHFRETDKLTPEDMKKFEEALDEHNDINSSSFNYKGTNGSGSAYITGLKSKNWMLVQSLPSSVTSEMTGSANYAGIRLEIMLIAAFVAYLAYLAVKNWRSRRRLVTENREMSDIVSAVTQLFTRFSLVDFQTDTYQYLANKNINDPSLSISGKYTELRAFLENKYVKDENSDDMSTVISPEFAKKHLTKDVKYLQYEYEIDFGEKRWENISIFCIKRRKGVPATVLYAIQDVTPLKKREQEIRLALKNSSEAAEAANRAKSDFLARMSHDIRTPMNAIMGMTAVAAMHLDDNERLIDCLSKITVSSRHLLALINDVLDMSKIESGKVSLSEEPFSMADMVDGVVTIIREQAKSKNQELRVHINDIAHENVIGDQLRLRQVLVNILGNAVKFTPEGGKVIFTIRENESRIHGMACFEFVCEDTGMGMDKEFIKTIFDPFSRSNESVTKNIEGTGLGMPITRNIVRMMSGDIEVESEPGVGSKFTVRLHLKIQEQGDDGVGGLVNLRVLVADDDESACITTCEILGNIGMKSEWVMSGDEAVARTVSEYERGESFSVIILDWKMPGKDGVATAREIRSKIGDKIPIIILSAYDWTDIEAEAREAGISAFIEKPLFRSRLVYALKSVITSEQDSPEETRSDLEKADFSGKRVLLVEDNELNMEIANELLGFTGIETDCAENGSIAVEKIKNSEPGYYDLVFMDIQMPVMNGYEASKAIRALGRPDIDNLPIIAMTANAFSDDVWKSQEAGMNDHISKPVEIPKLLAMLNKWL